MLDRLSNDDVTKAIEELVACFGVKEDMPYDRLISLLQAGQVEECVQEVASRLGLPVRIKLVYVPKGYRRDSPRFHSTALARADRMGRGIEGIVAQVLIPQHLPLFGSSSLRGYPIEVHVTEDCHVYPHTFVAIIAHELAHVLLASLLSPHRDSELHADLVPILLGLRDVVRRGRRTIETTRCGNTVTTHVTTYGYLTDSQFEWACSYIARIVERHRHDQIRLAELVTCLGRSIAGAERRLTVFREYLDYLGRNPPSRMQPEHAQRVVQLFGQDWNGEWSARIAEVKGRRQAAEAFLRGVSGYTGGTVEGIRGHTQALEAAMVTVGEITKAIAKDEAILRRYISPFYRVWRALLRRWWTREG